MAGSGEPQEAEDLEPPLRGDPLCRSEDPLCASGHAKDNPTLVTVAGAVVSGLGVLGFVTFAGGVVLWIRFTQMGLPADHVLGLVPRSELVATGAEFLLRAVLLSTLFVLIAVFLSLVPEDLANKLSPGESAPEWTRRLPHERREFSRRTVAPAILGLLGLAASLMALFDGLPLGAFVVLVGVSTLGAFVVRACGHFSLPTFCLVAFISVGSFAVTRTYERTSHRLEVLPMAYSRSQPGEAPRVEIGYFVVETSDRILFASQPEGNGNPNELREFPRSETDDLEIGDLARPGQAEEHAARFAYNLCERLAHLRSTASTPTTRTGSRVVVVVSVHESSSAGRLLEERGSDEREVRVSRRARKSSPAPPPAQPSPVCTPEYVQELANKAGRPWLPQATECRTHLCITGKLS
jgi:hypothetical protein